MVVGARTLPAAATPLPTAPRMQTPAACLRPALVGARRRGQRRAPRLAHGGEAGKRREGSCTDEPCGSRSPETQAITEFSAPYGKLSPRSHGDRLAARAGRRRTVTAATLLERSVDELTTTAKALSAAAVEINST